MKKKLLLAEIVIVTLLLSILGIIFIPKFIVSQETAKIALAKYELSLIDKGFKQYNQDNGRFPTQTRMMTNPDMYKKLIIGKYVDKDRLKDPFLGPNEVTNDGDPSIYFWANVISHSYKYDQYNHNSNQYRGHLPGSFLYNLGASGPDKVINLDQPPLVFIQTTGVISTIKPVTPNGTNELLIQGKIVNIVENRNKQTGKKTYHVVDGQTLDSLLTSNTVELKSMNIKPTNNSKVIDPYSFNIFIDFDPSNGVISSGDIHLLGP